MKSTSEPAGIRVLTESDAEAFSQLRRAVTAVDPVGMGLSMEEELSRPIEGFRAQLGAPAPSTPAAPISTSAVLTLPAS